MSIAFQAYENIYIQLQLGTIDESRAEGFWIELKSYFAFPIIQQVWESLKHISGPEFRNFVDNEIINN